MDPASFSLRCTFTILYSSDIFTYYVPHVYIFMFFEIMLSNCC